MEKHAERREKRREERRKRRTEKEERRVWRCIHLLVFLYYMAVQELMAKDITSDVSYRQLEGYESVFEKMFCFRFLFCVLQQSNAGDASR